MKAVYCPLTFVKDKTGVTRTKYTPLDKKISGRLAPRQPKCKRFAAAYVSGKLNFPENLQEALDNGELCPDGRRPYPSSANVTPTAKCEQGVSASSPLNLKPDYCLNVPSDHSEAKDLEVPLCSSQTVMLESAQLSQSELKKPPSYNAADNLNSFVDSFDDRFLTSSFKKQTRAHRFHNSSQESASSPLLTLRARIDEELGSLHLAQSQRLSSPDIELPAYNNRKHEYDGLFSLGDNSTISMVSATCPTELANHSPVIVRDVTSETAIRFSAQLTATLPTDSDTSVVFARLNRCHSSPDRKIRSGADTICTPSPIVNVTTPDFGVLKAKDLPCRAAEEERTSNSLTRATQATPVRPKLSGAISCLTPSVVNPMESIVPPTPPSTANRVTLETLENLQDAVSDMDWKFKQLNQHLQTALQGLSRYRSPQ